MRTQRCSVSAPPSMLATLLFNTCSTVQPRPLNAEEQNPQIETSPIIYMSLNFVGHVFAHITYQAIDARLTVKCEAKVLLTSLAPVFPSSSSSGTCISWPESSSRSPRADSRTAARWLPLTLRARKPVPCNEESNTQAERSCEKLEKNWDTNSHLLLV